MKFIILIFLAIGTFGATLGQEIKVSKKEIKDWSAINVNNFLGNKKDLIKEIKKKNNKFSPDGRVAVVINDTESIIDYDDNYLYKVSPSNKTTGKVLTKLNKSQDKVASVELSAGGDLQVLAGGYLFTNDFAHGDMSGYTFYSPEFKVLGYYTPFENGATNTIYGTSEEYVCILSQQQMDAPKFKIALLNRTGKLLTEREFDSNNFLPSGVQIFNNMIFLNLVSSTDAKSKVISLKLNLEENYEKVFETRVIGRKLKFDEKSNLLLLGTLTTLKCFNSSTGSEIWSAEFPLGQNEKILTSEFAFNGKYVAVITAIPSREGRSKISKNENSTLIILNSKTGERVSTEKLGDLYNARILGGSKGFILMTNEHSFEYEN